MGRFSSYRIMVKFAVVVAVLVLVTLIAAVRGITNRTADALAVAVSSLETGSSHPLAMDTAVTGTVAINGRTVADIGGVATIKAGSETPKRVVIAKWRANGAGEADTISLVAVESRFSSVRSDVTLLPPARASDLVDVGFLYFVPSGRRIRLKASTLSPNDSSP